MGLTHGYRKQHLRVVLTLGKKESTVWRLFHMQVELRVGLTLGKKESRVRWLLQMQ